ncbi:MAG: hypothetical protein Q4A12_07350 [Eubacteriales bacterium]|nr:hypothetical protein [Eubacteriales bacterium]
MKKLLTIILVLMLCLSICACDSDDSDNDSTADVKTQAKVDIVDIDALLSDLETTGDAQQNISKGTTMFVKVVEILDDTVTVSHVFTEYTSKVYMDKKPEINEYLAIYGEVANVGTNENNNNFYTFKNCTADDITKMDDYVKSKVSAEDRTKLIEDSKYDFLYEYVASRDEVFRLGGDEIVDCIIGEWQTLNNSTNKCKFNDDYTVSYGAIYWYGEYEDRTGNYSVTGDKLSTFYAYPEDYSVYKLSDNEFIYDKEIYVR